MGEPFLLKRNGVDVEFGFYRNEYVISSSEQKAIASAKARTLRKFADRSARMVEGRPMTLRVEKIAKGVPPWRIFRNEGFLMFPADSR